MVSLNNGRADGASSQPDATSSSITISELLFVIGEIMLRTGRDFPIFGGHGNGSIREAVESRLARAGSSSSLGVASTLGQLRDYLAGGDINAITNTLAAMSVGIPATPAPAAVASTSANTSFPAVDTPRPGQAGAVINAPLVAAVASSPAPAPSTVSYANTAANIGVASLPAAPTANAGTVPAANDSVPATGAEPQGVEPATRWYAITAGRNVGVYSNWNTVAPLVVGVRGACFVRYSTRAEARRAFLDALANGSVRIVSPPGVMYPDFNPTNTDRFGGDSDDDEGRAGAGAHGFNIGGGSGVTA